MDWLFGGGKSKERRIEEENKNKQDIANRAYYKPFSKEDFSWLLTPYVAIPLSCAGALSTMLIYRRYLRRIPSAEYITPRTLATRSTIRGYVTSVGDADNFRMVHTPAPWPLSLLQRIPTDKKLLKNNTIHVRLAGVDAPEVCYTVLLRTCLAEDYPRSSHILANQLSRILQKL
jgi:hypothetical protein